MSHTFFLLFVHILNTQYFSIYLKQKKFCIPNFLQILIKFSFGCIINIHKKKNEKKWWEPASLKADKELNEIFTLQRRHWLLNWGYYFHLVIIIHVNYIPSRLNTTPGRIFLVLPSNFFNKLLLSESNMTYLTYIIGHSNSSVRITA